jgi:hypothetical protein
VSIEDEGIHAEALSGVAIAQARAGRFLDARSTAASIKNAPSCAEDALRAIASAQAQSGELTGALSTGDMVLVRWAGSIGEVGSAMATLRPSQGKSSVEHLPATRGPRCGKRLAQLRRGRPALPGEVHRSGQLPHRILAEVVVAP